MGIFSERCGERLIGILSAIWFDQCLDVFNQLLRPMEAQLVIDLIWCNEWVFLLSCKWSCSWWYHVALGNRRSVMYNDQFSSRNLWCDKFHVSPSVCWTDCRRNTIDGLPRKISKWGSRSILVVPNRLIIEQAYVIYAHQSAMPLYYCKFPSTYLKEVISTGFPSVEVELCRTKRYEMSEPEDRGAFWVILIALLRKIEDGKVRTGYTHGISLTIPYEKMYSSRLLNTNVLGRYDGRYGDICSKFDHRNDAFRVIKNPRYDHHPELSRPNQGIVTVQAVPAVFPFTEESRHSFPVQIKKSIPSETRSRKTQS